MRVSWFCCRCASLTLHSYQSSTSLRLRAISVSYWHLKSSKICLRSGPGQALTSTLTSPVDCFLRQFISCKHNPDQMRIGFWKPSRRSELGGQGQCSCVGSLPATAVKSTGRLCKFFPTNLLGIFFSDPLAAATFTPSSIPGAASTRAPAPPPRQKTGLNPSSV